jgi:predicted DNA-binding protein
MEKGSREKTRKIQIMISDSLNNRLSRASDRSGVTKSAFVRVALEREFALDQQLDAECARADKAQALEPKRDIPQPLLFEI